VGNVSLDNDLNVAVVHHQLPLASDTVEVARYSYLLSLIYPCISIS